MYENPKFNQNNEKILCERNGTAQAAAFHTLKSGSQQVSDLFGTRQTQRNHDLLRSGK